MRFDGENDNLGFGEQLLVVFQEPRTAYLLGELLASRFAGIAC